MILVVFLVNPVAKTILITFVFYTKPGSGRIIDTFGLFNCAEGYLKDFPESRIPLKNKTQDVFRKRREEE
uniref:Uncharacterized protein n=1 Tax=viral metagenome TaxID=1070528 RepID=A0A6C0K1Y9_9ZZZZ